jgi:hypothetical protein
LQVREDQEMSDIRMEVWVEKRTGVSKLAFDISKPMSTYDLPFVMAKEVAAMHQQELF